MYCGQCGIVPVPDDQLPVELPDIEDFRPTGDGKSPLAKVEDWVNTTCPSCGGPARRETDTMDTFACSSWYHFRFVSPRDKAAAFDPEETRYWAPVDLYVGGAEHAVMHLLYARFWCKVAQDAGYLDFGEPYAALRNQGMIQAEDGQKMSKSKGNVITPDSVVERYGADSLRLYELFIAPFEQSVAWSDRGVQGCYRFLNRYWGLVHDVLEWEGGEAAAGDAATGADGGGAQTEALAARGRDTTRLLHKTVRKVTTHIDGFRFNTAVSAMMELENSLIDLWNESRAAWSAGEWRSALTTVTLLLAPMTPHVADEVWGLLGNETPIIDAAWPEWDESLAADEMVTVVVQVNGKLRDRLETPVGAEKDAVLAAARELPNAARFLEGKQVVKEIYVPGKLVNFVVS